MAVDAAGLLFEQEVFRIQGAIFEVNRVMGPGFAEGVYQECLELEFAARAIPFRAQPQLFLSYKGKQLRQTFVPDLICFDEIIIELKACRELAPEHRAQLLNYLAITGKQLGLLVNFSGSGRAAVHRLALSKVGREPTQTHANAPL